MINTIRMQIAILGRQPKISLAELEVLFGANKVSEITPQIAQIDITNPLPQERLGGTIKSAKLLTRLENTSLSGAFTYLNDTVLDHLQYLPDGKLQLGISTYGFDVHTSWLLKQMLNLKKIIKKSGRSVRIIENKKPELESAQVLYNKLTGPLGWELMIIKDGKDAILAQTTGVQNIDDYSKRDFDRPKRDAFVGMLPPKLAQIMINFASQKPQLHPGGVDTSVYGKILLDPFCGTGVVLQEANLIGYDADGTDIDKRMVEFSKSNMEWLHKRLGKYYNESTFKVEQADATKHHWDFSPDLVVCETYLGKPLTVLPSPKQLGSVINEADHIAQGFLQNIAPQLKKGTRLCLALPAWHLGNTNFKHLNTLDQLTDLGYNRLDLKHASKQDLIYHREDQIVARELTILEKI